MREKRKAVGAKMTLCPDCHGYCGYTVEHGCRGLCGVAYHSTIDPFINNTKTDREIQGEERMTKIHLQDAMLQLYNFTAVEMDWVVRGLFALHKQQPSEAAAIQQLINKLANTVYQMEPLEKK